MKSLPFWISLPFVCLWIAAPAAASAADPGAAGKAVFEKARDSDVGYGDSRAVVKMELRSSSGEVSLRQMEIEVLERPDHGARSLIVFDNPPDVRGTKVLTHSEAQKEDEQWIYLPAFSRAKQISGSNKTSAFMGSEFTYEDINSIYVMVEKYSYRLLRDENLDGSSCSVVERIPLYGGSGYSRQEVWVDDKDSYIRKVEYFDRSGADLKTLAIDTFSAYAGGHWRPARMTMTNHANGRITVLTWDKYRFHNGLKASDFELSALKR